ncbi:MAG: hypothetical protein Kow00109_27980 [Acidobacteriota bacterium]
MTRSLGFALSAIAVGVLSVASAGAQECIIQFNLRNADRYIWGAPWNAECLGDFSHSHPFGNFGVSSNVGDERDSNQFPGWKYQADGTFEWNACKKDYPPPDCNRYNAEACTEQTTVAPSYGQYGNYGGGWMHFPVSCPIDWNYDGVVDTGGCLDLDDQPFTVSGNFMSVYELDPGAHHDFIRTTYHPNLSVTLHCPSWRYCEAVASDWVFPYQWEDEWGILWDPSDPEQYRLVNASIALEVVTGWFRYDGCETACIYNPNNPCCIACN